MSDTKDADLEDIFTEIGDFGPYQLVTVSLFLILNILTGATFMVSISFRILFQQSLISTVFLDLYHFDEYIRLSVSEEFKQSKKVSQK